MVPQLEITQWYHQLFSCEYAKAKKPYSRPPVAPHEGRQRNIPDWQPSSVSRTHVAHGSLLIQHAPGSGNNAEGRGKSTAITAFDHPSRSIRC
jgi:hypothetical protein